MGIESFEPDNQGEKDYSEKSADKLVRKLERLKSQREKAGDEDAVAKIKKQLKELRDEGERVSKQGEESDTTEGSARKLAEELRERDGGGLSEVVNLFSFEEIKEKLESDYPEKRQYPLDKIDEHWDVWKKMVRYADKEKKRERIMNEAIEKASGDVNKAQLRGDFMIMRAVLNRLKKYNESVDG